MKKEIADLVEQKKWAEASEYIQSHRDEFTFEELGELEKKYNESMGTLQLDEEELRKISGGTATGTGNGSGQITGNDHYWCKTVSKRNDCADSVRQTSWCWYNDACTLVYHHYNDKKGWNDDLETDY